MHLKSLVGYCAACSKAHAQKRGHNLVLNIQKTPKQGQQEIVQVKCLAIGKPGGIDAETDKYDLKVTAICYECNVKMDEMHPKVKPVIESIMQANSAMESSAVQEWELEL